MSRPTAAYVDLDNISFNINSIKKHVGSTKIMCMVKADAYGHGLIPVAKVCAKEGAYALGVATVEEGVALRNAGITLPILCVGACFESSHEDAVRYDITQTLYGADCLDALSRACKRLNKRATVHVKIDSGMARLGVQSEQEMCELLDALKEHPEVELTGAFTHFATSDCLDKSFTDIQAALFDKMLEILKQHGYGNIIRHASCSGATIDCPSLYYDMVRPGIALYGYYPSNEVNKAALPLRPALRWETRLTQVKTVKKGQSIGYGRSYFADKDMRIGVLPVGYGDGYRRGNSNKGYCIINGSRANIVGRVCMDQLMVDITDIEGATEGALVTLIGAQGEEHIYADEMAEICDTISYEILLNISKRVPKVYCGRTP